MILALMLTLQVKYEKKMKMVRDDLELRRKQEIHEIEERKVSIGLRVVSTF